MQALQKYASWQVDAFYPQAKNLGEGELQMFVPVDQVPAPYLMEPIRRLALKKPLLSFSEFDCQSSQYVLRGKHHHG